MKNMNTLLSKNLIETNLGTSCIKINDVDDFEKYACADNLSPVNAYVHLFNKFPNKFRIDGIEQDELPKKDYYTIKLDISRFCDKLHSKYKNVQININEEQYLNKYDFTRKGIIKQFKDKGHISRNDINVIAIIPEKELIIFLAGHISGSTIYYQNYNDMLEIKKLFMDNKNIIKIESNPIKTISLVRQTQSGYDLYSHEIKQMEVNVKKHYNDDFVEADKKIVEFVNEENSSGLVILNGEKGTGKTTYIRHLINTTNRKFVYLTKDMARALVDPAFISFLATISGSVLVIEDCENLVAARAQGNHDTGISNLLNLCDGLLSDIFNIKIIATFNEDISKIDSALLRKGRLIYRYEFSKLCTEKTNKLLKALKIKYQSTEPMALCDIFGYNENVGQTEKVRKKIGF